MSGGAPLGWRGVLDAPSRKKRLILTPAARLILLQVSSLERGGFWEKIQEEEDEGGERVRRIGLVRGRGRRG